MFPCPLNHYVSLFHWMCSCIITNIKSNFTDLALQLNQQVGLQSRTTLAALENHQMLQMHPIANPTHRLAQTDPALDPLKATNLARPALNLIHRVVLKIELLPLEVALIDLVPAQAVPGHTLAVLNLAQGVLNLDHKVLNLVHKVLNPVQKLLNLGLKVLSHR